MHLQIRKIEQSDAQVVVELSGQLGYIPTLDQVKGSILQCEHHPDYCGFCALSEGRVIGWIQALQTYRLESGRFAEIVGLVVDEKHRKKGVAKSLIEVVKLWARDMHHTKLRVRTNVKRLETHRFYEKLGFTEKKEQKVFEIEP